MSRRKRDDVARAERLERSMFRAARAYRPPASTRLRALAVVAAVSTSATAGAAGAAAAGATAAATGAAGAPIGLAATLVSKAGGTTWLSMWLGALLVTAGTVGYVAIGDTSADPPPRSTEATSRSTSMPAPARRAEGLDTDVRAPNMVVDTPAPSGAPNGAQPPPTAAASAARFAPRPVIGEPVAVPTPSASTTTPASPAAASPAPTGGAATADELAAEIEMLDRARAHLAAGQPGEARAELRRRQARFPRGRLGLEAQLIDMEALMRSGQRDEARALARTFLDAHPNHLLAGRVRGLVGIDDAGTTP